MLLAGFSIRVCDVSLQLFEVEVGKCPLIPQVSFDDWHGIFYPRLTCRRDLGLCLPITKQPIVPLNLVLS